MNNCMIIPSYIDGTIRQLTSPDGYDYIICADGGYAHALAEDIRPDLIIGDFDSYDGELPDDIEILRVPAEKDDTDMGLCVRHALSLNFEEIHIIGGIGGRFDHSMANLQLMAGALDSHPKTAITLFSHKNILTILSHNELKIPRKKGYKLSLVSFSDKCEDVCISGVFYPLRNARLHNTFPLGISNEFVEDFATVSVGEGKLLIALSCD